MTFWPFSSLSWASEHSCSHFSFWRPLSICEVECHQSPKIAKTVRLLWTAPALLFLNSGCCPLEVDRRGMSNLSVLQSRPKMPSSKETLTDLSRLRLTLLRLRKVCWARQLHDWFARWYGAYCCRAGEHLTLLALNKVLCGLPSPRLRLRLQYALITQLTITQICCRLF